MTTRPCSAAVPAAVGWASRPPSEGETPSRQPARRRRYFVWVVSGCSAVCSRCLLIPAAAANYQRGAVVRVAQIYLSPDHKFREAGGNGSRTRNHCPRNQPGVGARRGQSDRGADRHRMGARQRRGAGLHSERRQDTVWRGGRLRRPGQPQAWTQRRGAGCHAALLSRRRIFSHVAAGGRSHVPLRRYPLAAGESGRVLASVGPGARILSSRRHGREIHERGHQEISRHQVGRSGGFPLDRQQAVRRLAGQFEVSGKRIGNLSRSTPPSILSLRRLPRRCTTPPGAGRR